MSLASELESKYAALAAQATDETVSTASVQVMLNNPSVQAIIGMGTDALPLLFRDLRGSARGYDWKMATIATILKTHGLPPVRISEESKGVLRRMVWCYIGYGRAHSYL